MKKLFFLFLSLFVFSLCLDAQTVDTSGIGSNAAFEGDNPVIDKLLNIYTLLIGALTIIWGIIAKAFGLKKTVPRFVFVVIAGGIVIAGAFLAFGLADAIPAVFAILSAMGVWDLVKGVSGGSVTK